MPKIDFRQVKTHLSRYVEEAVQGKEIIITKAGKPVVRIVPIGTAKATRKLGLLDKKARIPDNFNEPLPDTVLAEFFGRE